MSAAQSRHCSRAPVLAAGCALITVVLVAGRPSAARAQPTPPRPGPPGDVVPGPGPELPGPPDPAPLLPERPAGAVEQERQQEQEQEREQEQGQEPEQGQGGSGGLSAEEMAELEAALGADAAQTAKEQPAQRSGNPVLGALQSMNPDISLILDVSLAYFSDADHGQTGGHDPTRTGFNLQQLEMALGQAVDPYFRLDANLVFGPEGVEVEEAYATTLALPASLQARVGRMLTRVGRVNATHPHAWDFVDQPLVIGRLFGEESNAGLGFELSYLTPLPWYVEIIGAVNEAESRSFLGEDLADLTSPLDFQTSLVVEQFFELSRDLSLLFGLNLATGPNATGADQRTTIYGADIYLKYRPTTRRSDTVVALQAEVFARRRELPGDLLSDVGGYAYVYWRMSKRWGVAARHEFGTPARNRAGETGADDLDPDWTANRWRSSANLTFFPTEFSRIRLQGSVDQRPWLPDPVYATFLSFEFVIGAHGAHRF